MHSNQISPYVLLLLCSRTQQGQDVGANSNLTEAN